MVNVKFMAIDDIVDNGVKFVVSSSNEKRLRAAYRTLRNDLLSRDCFNNITEGNNKLVVSSSYGQIDLELSKMKQGVLVCATGNYVGMMPDYLSGRLSKFGNHVKIGEYQE